jgi:hypothetical protein
MEENLVGSGLSITDVADKVGLVEGIGNSDSEEASRKRVNPTTSCHGRKIRICK